MAFDRRSFFGLAGATTLGAALGVPATLAATGQLQAFAGGSSVPFYGEHQAGIATPMQDRLYMAAFNVENISRDELKSVLKEMTSAADRMTRGLGAGPIGAVNGQLESPPDDTGEAMDLAAARVTVTVGFGATIFDSRFGFGAKKPANFNELPRFAKDEVPADRLGTDLIIQVCADDDQVAFHAIRNLIREAKVAQMYSSIQTGNSVGMQTLDQSLLSLFRRQKISLSTLQEFIKYPQNLNLMENPQPDLLAIS